MVCMYACRWYGWMDVCMVRTYACMYVWMYACIHVRINVCMYTCMCASVCMSVCLSVCLYVCMYAVCMDGGKPPYWALGTSFTRFEKRCNNCNIQTQWKIEGLKLFSRRYP